MIYILFFGVSGVVTKLLIQNKHPVCFSFFFSFQNSGRLSTFCLFECVTPIFELKVRQMSCAATESVLQCHLSVCCPVYLIGWNSHCSVLWLVNLRIPLHLIGQYATLWSWSQEHQRGVLYAEGELTHPSINSQNAVHLQKANPSPRRRWRKGYSATIDTSP